MAHDKTCIPAEPGYYWATSKRWGWRAIVLISKNGHGHTRAFEHRFKSSFDTCEFDDYSARIADPRECAEPAEDLRRLVLEGKCRITDEDFRRADLGRVEEEWLIEQLAERGFAKGRTTDGEDGQNEWWPPERDLTAEASAT